MKNMRACAGQAQRCGGDANARRDRNRCRGLNWPDLVGGRDVQVGSCAKRWMYPSTVAMGDRNSTRRSRNSCRSSKLKSSSAPIRPKDLWCFPAVGLSSVPSPGSIAAEGLPRIGKTSIARRSHSCASHQSASCSENFVILLDGPGQTLSMTADLQPGCEVEILPSARQSGFHYPRIHCREFQATANLRLWRQLAPRPICRIGTNGEGNL